jgi:sporulation protein YlmC with PRC-barrel domain
MIRKLLATTAIITLVSTGAFAQATTTEPAPATPPAATDAAPAASDAAPAGGSVSEAQTTGEGQLASNLIGENVYNSTGEDAETIGDVNDLVLSPEGQIEAIVIGVGGFLGIGEKDVAVDYSTIDWAERDGDRWIVISATADQLKELPAFDRAPYQPVAPVASNDAATPAPSTGMTPPATDGTAAAPAAPATDDTAAAPAAPATDNSAAAPAAPADDTAAAPAATDTTETAAIDRSTLKEVNAAELRTEDFVGTTVYGADDANVGEIGDVVLGEGDKVDAVIIDVGGFLGVGEKEVAVGMDNLAFMADEDGDRYLYTKFTKEQLDAAPAYDEANYAAKRDEMRIVVPN